MEILAQKHHKQYRMSSRGLLSKRDGSRPCHKTLHNKIFPVKWRSFLFFFVCLLFCFWTFYHSFLSLEIYYRLINSWVWENSSRIYVFIWRLIIWGFTYAITFTIIIWVWSSVIFLIIFIHILIHLMIVKFSPLSIFFYLPLWKDIYFKNSDSQMGLLKVSYKTKTKILNHLQ